MSGWLNSLFFGAPAQPAYTGMLSADGPAEAMGGQQAFGATPAQPARMGLLDPNNAGAAGLFTGLQNLGAQLVAAGRPGGGGWAQGLATGGAAFSQGMQQGQQATRARLRQQFSDRVLGDVPDDQLTPQERAARASIPASLRGLGNMLEPGQVAGMAAQAGMNRVRPMTPQEVQAMGLRPGTVAYVNENTGAPQVVQQSDEMSPGAFRQRQALQNGGPESFSAPQEVMQNGQRVLVQFGNRGSVRPVGGNYAPSAPNTSLVPTPGYDDQGQPVALFPDGRGGFVQAQTPPGVTLAPRTREIRVGNEVITVDQGGREISRRPIDSFSPARDAASGRAQGEAAGTEVAGAPQAVRTAETTLEQIDAVLGHRALNSGTGLSGRVLNQIPGTPTYDFAQRVEQLQGRAFLQAFESLKGGGAITEVEGAKATQAIARLSTAQSPADFRQALGELRQIVADARDRARRLAPNAAPSGGVPIPGTGMTATPPPAAGGWSIRPVQ